ncbi:hypothetical protein AB1Y20_003623 [Prymnesium parvum]|uniref:Major facilitator superfamily (MFS) profile domain-containing protein n=1 Tax=Prymnesium parvum TaxID=97485 RepID=A0AB34J6S3_PRYPA
MCQPTHHAAPPAAHGKAGLQNKNAQLILVYSFLLSVYSSLVSNTPLTVYISMITSTNTDVGIATGIQGIVNLLIALPVGALADVIGRELLLRAAAVMALIAAAYTAVCLLYIHGSGEFDNHTTYLSLCGASALWGLFMGLHASPLEALFGDSVATGDRSQIYVWRSSLRTLGSVVGPLVSIFCFITHNQWDLHELTVILLVGVGFAIPPAVCLFFFRDKNSLGDASEGLHSRRAASPAFPQAAAEAPPPQEPPPPHDSPLPPLQREHSSPKRHGQGEELAAAPPLDSALVGSVQEEERVASCRMCGCLFTVDHVAPLVALSDTLGFVGNGMTVKFFPVFFKDKLELLPITVNLIMLAGPIGIAAVALLMQRVSLRLGRVPTAVLCKATGASMLVAIACIRYVPQTGAAAKYAIVPLYLMRTWLINCTSGLTKSVLNDYVPKRNRGKWNALESVNLFSWSGSALLGGYLSTEISYKNTFLITSGMQFCSVACLLPLISLVAAESQAHLRRPKLEQVVISDATSSTTCTSPLLAAGGSCEARACGAR